MHGHPPTRNVVTGTVAVLAVTAALTGTAQAQDRRCTLYATSDEEFVARLAACGPGDVLSAALAESLGSPLAYATLVCDFRQQIVTDAVQTVDPDTGAPVRANILACVLTGRVRDAVPG
jgi:hypothetical protein